MGYSKGLGGLPRDLNVALDFYKNCEEDLRCLKGQAMIYLIADPRPDVNETSTGDNKTYIDPNQVYQDDGWAFDLL